MKLLLTSGGVTNAEHPRGARTAPRQAGLRVPRPGRPDGAVGSPDVRTGVGARPGGRRARLPALLRSGLGLPRCPRAHRTAHHRRGAMGSLGPGGRRAPGRRRRRDVPVPLDAGVRAGRSAAVAARHGLGGGERRKHGDDAPDRRVPSSSGRPRRTTAPWESSTSRSSRTSTPSRRTPWRTQSGGLPRSASRPTPSTSRRPSRSSTAPSRWSPKGDGRRSGRPPMTTKTAAGTLPRGAFRRRNRSIRDLRSLLGRLAALLALAAGAARGAAARPAGGSPDPARAAASPAGRRCWPPCCG